MPSTALKKPHNRPLVSKLIIAGMGGIGVGLGLLLIVMYPFSGGLLLPGPLNQWFLLVGSAFLFGAPFSLSLILDGKNITKRDMFKTVLYSFIIAIVISLTLFLLRLANYFQALLYFEIIYSAIFIVLVKKRKVDSAYRQSSQSLILSAVIPTLLTLFLVNTATAEPLESLHILGLSIILYPSVIWMGTILFKDLFDRLQS
jgi:hypothetical protein